MEEKTYMITINGVELGMLLGALTTTTLWAENARKGQDDAEFGKEFIKKLFAKLATAQSQPEAKS